MNTTKILGLAPLSPDKVIAAAELAIISLHEWNKDIGEQIEAREAEIVAARQKSWYGRLITYLGDDDPFDFDMTIFRLENRREINYEHISELLGIIEMSKAVKSSNKDYILISDRSYNMFSHTWEH